MKKLLLLFLILPLAACQSAETIQKQQMAQEQEVGDACAATSQPQQDCVNTYLEIHYGWRVMASNDGSFRAIPPTSAPSAISPSEPIYNAAGFGNDDFPSTGGR